MNTKTLSNRSLSVIDQYLNFKMGRAICSIPYFNNRTIRKRATLRAYGGKGSPKDIYEEVESILLKSHVAVDSLSGEALKKLLTDQNIGIDCSGFAYYILNAENEETGKGGLDKHISFTNCHGLIGKIRCSIRPVENCDVSTLADDKNSHLIATREINPGDMIIMTENNEENERDHILIIHQVEYQNFVPYKIHYSHAIAYPEDGIYGTGIKQGVIEITDIEKPLTDQIWIENKKQGDLNRIYIRAKKSKTEVRRLNWS